MSERFLNVLTTILVGAVALLLIPNFIAIANLSGTNATLANVIVTVVVAALVIYSVRETLKK